MKKIKLRKRIRAAVDAAPIKTKSLETITKDIRNPKKAAKIALLKKHSAADIAKHKANGWEYDPWKEGRLRRIDEREWWAFKKAHNWPWLMHGHNAQMLIRFVQQASLVYRNKDDMLAFLPALGQGSLVFLWYAVLESAWTLDTKIPSWVVEAFSDKKLWTDWVCGGGQAYLPAEMWPRHADSVAQAHDEMAKRVPNEWRDLVPRDWPQIVGEETTPLKAITMNPTGFMFKTPAPTPPKEVKKAAPTMAGKVIEVKEPKVRTRERGMSTAQKLFKKKEAPKAEEPRVRTRSRQASAVAVEPRKRERVAEPAPRVRKRLQTPETRVRTRSRDR